MTSTQVSAPPGQVERMDRMYGFQRYFYDATRKYYLFGRDRLIARMPIADGEKVAEIGCGTGRNLVLLARRHPRTHFCGVDAAHVMIETATQKVARQTMSPRIHLRQGMAEELDARVWFDVPTFDRVFFSYSLSMIPTWSAALEAAMGNLRPGGELWVVDFWDQGGYPRVFARFLRWWLALYHVHHRPELLAYLRGMEAEGRGRLTLEPVGRRYAYLARFIKNN